MTHGCVKKSIIFSSVCFSKIALEIMFTYNLESKKAFGDDNNVNFFKSKKWVFSKGFTHGFGKKKSTISSSVFFSKIGLEIMFNYGLERKEAFEDDKNLNFFRSKKSVFSKGVHPWFRSKNPHFFLVCFSAK